MICGAAQYSVSFGNNFVVQCSAVSQIKNICGLQTQNFVSATSLLVSFNKKIACSDFLKRLDLCL